MTTFEECLAVETGRVWHLLKDIGRRTRDEPGITRPAWSTQDELAADLIRAHATDAGLQVVADAFGNLHILPPKQALETPAITSGSHLDSVPHGGNYDGLAGVAAALAVLIAGGKAGSTKPMRAIAMRCEESPWFSTAYLGSRLMLGHETLDSIGGLVRFDSGRTLRAHIEMLGYPRKDVAVAPLLHKTNTLAFLELHIEQGPLLEAEDVPVGIATAIRGNVRFPNAKCFGAYAHSAALPRRFRQDAVLAVAQLALELDGFWARRIANGDEDFVATVGKFTTDAAEHAMTKVAGEVSFSLNIGAASKAAQDEARSFILQSVDRIARERNVRFDLGREVGSNPTPIDDHILRLLEQAARKTNVRTRRLPTVGHDSAMFALAGIPVGMVMVRNSNGSHNPKEALEQSDFASGVRVLAEAMLDFRA